MSENNPESVRFQGPLAPFRAGFVAELRNQGYKESGCLGVVKFMAAIDRWLLEHELQPQQFSEAMFTRFKADWRRSGKGLPGAKTIAVYLRRVGAIPQAEPAIVVKSDLDVFIDDYAGYLKRERSLCADSISRHRRWARKFLTAIHHSLLHLQALDSAAIGTYVLREAQKVRPGGFKNQAMALRGLLRYLYLHRHVTDDLSGAVPSMPRKRLASLPKYLTPEERDRVLEAANITTPAGRRAKAVLFLLLRLGLRAGEVAALTLDDFDWRRGELLVRGKGGRIDTLPLPHDVGQAVVSYIQSGRPASTSRSLILSVYAPFHRIDADTIGTIVGSLRQRSGIPTLQAHRLRHTAATDMLRGGASLREVKEALRHKAEDTTAIYAKVDHSALRLACRVWPGGRP